MFSSCFQSHNCDIFSYNVYTYNNFLTVACFLLILQFQVDIFHYCDFLPLKAVSLYHSFATFFFPSKVSLSESTVFVNRAFLLSPCDQCHDMLPSFLNSEVFNIELRFFGF